MSCEFPSPGGAGNHLRACVFLGQSGGVYPSTHAHPRLTSVVSSLQRDCEGSTRLEITRDHHAEASDCDAPGPRVLPSMRSSYDQV